MKRLLIRLSAIAAVLVLGCIAIAQAQRGNDDSVLPEAVPRSSEPADRAVREPLLVPAAPRAGADQKTAGSGVSEDTASAPAPPADPFGLSRLSAGGNAARPTRRPDRQDPSSSAVILGAPRRLSAPPARPLEPLRGPARTEAETAGPAVDPSHVQAGATDLASGNLESPSVRRRPAPLKQDPLGSAISESPSPPYRGNAVDPPAVLDGSPRDAVGLAAVNEGTGKPGSKQLEGIQAPQVSIQKSAPAEIQVGKPAVFQVKVRNVGPVPAHGVEIRDRIPAGTRLIDTTPPASRGVRGELVWVLGTLKPGGETLIEMRIMPTAEGEIGSVARLHFHTDASVRTVATRPQLLIQATAAKRVLIGEQVTLSITISNPGSGVATGVVLEERVPPGLQHSAGAELEYEVGQLKPGETKRLELALLATRPGTLSNLLVARGDAQLLVEEKLQIEVVAPKLDLALNGPRRRYLEREAAYTLSVSNPGTATAEGVRLAAYLPVGLKFLGADNNGHYDPETRAVHWTLAELPVDETGSVQLRAMPIEAGRQKIRFSGVAEKVAPVEKEEPLLIEGIAAILFEVRDVDDPIEVGAQTTYEIRVLNQGSKAAGNLRLAAILPPGMKPVAAEGPAGTRHAVEANRVLFDPLARLAPKADTTYRVRVQGLQPGDQRIRVQLQTDEMETPVTKEESTRVFSDQ